MKLQTFLLNWSFQIFMSPPPKFSGAPFLFSLPRKNAELLLIVFLSPGDGAGGVFSGWNLNHTTPLKCY